MLLKKTRQDSQQIGLSSWRSTYQLFFIRQTNWNHVFSSSWRQFIIFLQLPSCVWRIKRLKPFTKFVSFLATRFLESSRSHCETKFSVSLISFKWKNGGHFFNRSIWWTTSCITASARATRSWSWASRPWPSRCFVQPGSHLAKVLTFWSFRLSQCLTLALHTQCTSRKLCVNHMCYFGNKILVKLIITLLSASSCGYSIKVAP